MSESSETLSLKMNLKLSILTLLFGASSFLNGAEPKHLDLYLLIGQSNMAGRGQVEAQDQKKPKRVLALNKENQWVPAVDPIHFDKKSAGVSLGRTFGIMMAEQDRNATIGLIPCAVGGTSIRKWQPGEQDPKTKAYPYDDMLTRLRIAMKSGTVKGILWHQGESDGGRARIYEDSLKELIQRVRAECGNSEIPFVIGQLGQFEERPWSAGRIKIDAAHQAVASEVPNCVFVTSEGLKDKGDLTHFSAEALREFGGRYAMKMIELQKK